MRQIEVYPIHNKLLNAADIPTHFEKENITYHKINIVNWADEYPYCPNVEFAIAYQNDAILLHYRVEENSPRATVAND